MTSSFKIKLCNMTSHRQSSHAVVARALVLLFYNCFVVKGVEVIDDIIELMDSLQYASNLAEKDVQLDLECGIWVAPSTIDGAGLGMFAGRDFRPQEELLPSGDSMVPIVDYRYHALASSKTNHTWLWDEYSWNSDKMLAHLEGKFQVMLASPGFGSVANSFIPLFNVEEWFAEKDSTGLHRSKDPGVGGFSPYHSRKSTARLPIVAGDELFVDCKFP